MRVINLTLDGKVIIVGEVYEQHFETVVSKEEIQEKFNINFGDAITATYEPDRQLYFIEYPGGDVKGFKNPEDNPILSSIHSRANEIFNFYFSKIMQNNLPKYHVLKEGKPVLLEQFEEAYTTELAIDEAKSILRNTAWAVVEYQEQGIPLPDEIKEARENARNLLGADLIKEMAMIDAGYDVSQESETLELAGIKKK